MTASSTTTSEMVIPTRLFGPVTITDSQIIHFADGLAGFASQHRFVLLPTDSEGLFWLQSADEGNLAFLVIDPFMVHASYEVPMPADGFGPFSPGEYDDLIVLTTVTLPHEPGLHATTNLTSPLIVNPATQQGVQMVVEGSDHSARHAVPLGAPS